MIEAADQSSAQAKYARRQSEQSREIGSVPQIANPERRRICERDFKQFCEQYHSELFVHAWSDDHLKVIKKIESAVLDGGQFGMAMPRGSGKTTLCYVACEWALVYAHRSFVVLIGAEQQASLELLDAIRTDLENNELMLDDFPEVVYPIRSLDGIAHRCNGQTCGGKRTQMTWTSDRVVLPTVAGSKASGATLRVSGITGRLRGMMSKTPDGHSIRPDLVIVDDPQTDDSARSASQNDYRERLLSGAVLGLAGPGKTIAAIMPCTVIRSEDMADRILDRKRHPEWRGERTRLVYEWPKATKLWEQYSDIWSGDLRNGGDGSAATEFYSENREVMDAGAKIAWSARHEKSELSAIQHAYNLRLRIGEESFEAEYQNNPTDTSAAGRPITLTADDLASKVSKVDKRVVPDECTRLTAMIDISQKCLWWTVCAFDDRFTGSVIDYGIWPDQGQRYNTLKTVKKTLQRRHRGHGIEAAILRGLEELSEFLMAPWKGENGTEYRIERLLIDEGDGEHTTIVRNFCRRSGMSALMFPAKGRGIKASSRPLCDGKPKPGERFGDHCKIVRNRDGSRTVHTDVNYWKTFAMRRFETPRGDPASFTIYKGSPRHHQMFADQVTAETPKEIEDVGSGNRVIEWANVRKQDNHFLDCVVGCCAGASMLGVKLKAEAVEVQPKVRKRRVAYL